MGDYVTLWDDYSIQFNKTLEFDLNGDWDEAGENFAKLAYEYYHDQLQKQPRS